MKIVVKMKFGSHLYGTNIETSDTDYKGVYIPEAEDIIMQRTKKTINSTTKKDPNGKNSSDDIDMEYFSIQEYMRLLLEGQTVAIDMLFAPDNMLLEVSDTWREIQKNKDKFLHKGVNAFIGYCRVQANKYGLKGSRVAAMRMAVETLKPIYAKHPHDQLQDHMSVLLDLVERDKNSGADRWIDIVELKAQRGCETHLQVCGRKVPVTAKVNYTYEVFRRVFENYGARAILAEQNKGVDRKALLHAVRVLEEGKELLRTGKITFPRPEKDLLLAVRKGEMEYNQVAEIIEKGFDELIDISEVSTMQEKPDYKAAEQLVYDCHFERIQIQFLKM